MTHTRPSNERGSALVLALGVLVVLGVLAVVIVSVATSDRWTASSEYTNNRAFYSADAASEASINWIRMQGTPPPILDGSNRVFIGGSFTTLSTGHTYKADVTFISKRFRPGWSTEYKDYEYTITADGASSQQSAAAVDVSALRLFREGY